MKKTSSADKGRATTKPATKKKHPRAKRKPVMRFSREGKAKS